MYARVHVDVVRALAVVAILIGASNSAPSAFGQSTANAKVTRMAYPTGNASTSVIMLERITPNEVRIGERFEYSLRLTNLTTAPVEELVLTERLPAAFTSIEVSPQPQSSAGGAARWELGTLAPRASTTVRFVGSASTVGELPSCATITFTTKACSSIRVVQPELVLAKTTPPEVMLCDRIPMTLAVTNTGSGVARQVRIEDQLPDGWTTSDGKTRVAFDAGDLSAGRTREFAIDLRSSRTGTFQNDATATEAGGLSARASSTTRVIQPLLMLEKTGPAVRYIGRPATFDLTVRNDGDAPARDAVLVDTLPGGVNFLNASHSGDFSAGRVTWNLGTLPPGDARKVSVTLAPAQQGTFENRAMVRAYCTEATAAVTLQAKGIPAILLEVIDLDDPIELSANERYEISVLNQGSAMDTNIVITCELPPEQQFVSADGPAVGRAEGRRVIFAPLPSLAPKARATYRVVTKGIQEGDVRFKVTLTSDQLTKPVEETESTHIYN